MSRKKNENVHSTERIENDFHWIKSKKMYAANKNRLCDWALDDFRRKNHIWNGSLVCIIVSLRITKWLSYGRATSYEWWKGQKTEEISFKSSKSEPENISLSSLAFTLAQLFGLLLVAISSPNLFPDEWWTHAVHLNFNFSKQWQYLSLAQLVRLMDWYIQLIAKQQSRKVFFRRILLF